MTAHSSTPPWVYLSGLTAASIDTPPVVTNLPPRGGRGGGAPRLMLAPRADIISDADLTPADPDLATGTAL